MDLEAIENRANAAKNGPWESAEFSQDSNTGRWSALCAVCPHLIKDIAGTEEGARKAFQLHIDIDHPEHVGAPAARSDVPDLVARVRELEEENQKLRDSIASQIFADEQKCQEAIDKDPTSPHLHGRLAGLQRARDIVNP